MYARLAVCMWASVSVRRAALCAASVSSWGGTVRNTRVLHVACRFAKTARLRRTAALGGNSLSMKQLASLLVEGHHYHRGAIPADDFCLTQKFGFSFLEADGIDHTLALQTFQTGF